TVWFRNVWSWGWGDPQPSLHVDDGRVVGDHATLGRMVATSSGAPAVLVCDNESNAARLWGSTEGTKHPQDAINDAGGHGAATCNPDQVGTKAAFHHVLTVAGGASVELRLRLSDGATDLGAEWEQVMAEREREADEYYTALLPPEATAEERLIARQAFAG